MEKKITSDLEAYLITQLILEYRVSLDDISKMFNKDNIELYNKLLEYNKNELENKALRYVLDYETKHSSKASLEYARKQVRSFFTKLHFTKTKEEKIELINNLKKNNQVVSNIRKQNKTILSDDEVFALTKYRLKYGLSRKVVSEILNIKEHVFRKYEDKIQDNVLIERLNILNQYNDYKIDNFHPKSSKR